MPATLTPVRTDDRAAQRQATLHGVMAAAVLCAIREGRDERLPSVSCREPRPEGLPVSEWLSNCDATQEQLLFKLLHLVLNKDNVNAIHAVGQELAEYVANDFAELFVASRGE